MKKILKISDTNLTLAKPILSFGSEQPLTNFNYNLYNLSNEKKNRITLKIYLVILIAFLIMILKIIQPLVL